MSEETKPTCDLCPSPVWLGTKRNPATKCAVHFGCVCPECGHEGFFIEPRRGRGAGRWFCFSLNCEWSSETHPHPEKQRETHPAHGNYPGGCPKELLEEYRDKHFDDVEQEARGG